MRGNLKAIKPNPKINFSRNPSWGGKEEDPVYLAVVEYGRSNGVPGMYRYPPSVGDRFTFLADSHEAGPINTSEVQDIEFTNNSSIITTRYTIFILTDISED